MWPKPTKRLKLGFVGGGRGALVGEWHAMGARMSNRWEIVAGALSSKPDIAAESAKDWMLERSYDDFAVMAAAEAAHPDGIDAVAICTPNHTHFTIAKAFLENGIGVICDKPMVTTMDEARELVSLVQQSGVFFGVTYTYSFHSMVRQMKAMVAKGMIGKVRQAHVEYVQDWASGASDPATKQAAWRRDPALAGRASVTGDIGTHAFHLIHFVTGEPVNEVSARFHICGGAERMEDTAFMQLKMGADIPATLWCTQAAPGNACGLRLRVYGESGGLEWNQEHPEIVHHTRVGEPTQILMRGHGKGMLPEAEHMIRLPRGHAEGVSDAWCSLYTEMAIALEAHRAGERANVMVPDVVDGARGVFFVDASADSAEADGAWQKCWFEG
ncbi:Gfo/Idh/MocA family protein [Pseudahrensia aquimaris]|uniref:Gfo/Idh/MocA family protein n=1 Tax=Pseudahrensia aquimaris TaxID=744461 RepID=A0ABW3FGE7_9HYPH